MSSDHTPEIEIRPMFATDLKRGFLEALSSLKPVELTEEEALEVFRRRMRYQVQTYVAILQDKVVGTATLLIEPKFIHHGGVTGHIEDVAIHKSYQSLGLGAALVRHLLEVCRQEGCYKVILDCAAAVIPFYEKLGFSRWEQAMRIDLEPVNAPAATDAASAS